jgi:hypothetical protein
MRDGGEIDGGRADRKFDHLDIRGVGAEKLFDAVEAHALSVEMMMVGDHKGALAACKLMEAG